MGTPELPRTEVSSGANPGLQLTQLLTNLAGETSKTSTKPAGYAVNNANAVYNRAMQVSTDPQTALVDSILQQAAIKFAPQLAYGLGGSGLYNSSTVKLLQDNSRGEAVSQATDAVLKNQASALQTAGQISTAQLQTDKTVKDVKKPNIGDLISSAIPGILLGKVWNKFGEPALDSGFNKVSDWLGFGNSAKSSSVSGMGAGSGVSFGTGSGAGADPVNSASSWFSFKGASPAATSSFTNAAEVGSAGVGAGVSSVSAGAVPDFSSVASSAGANTAFEANSLFSGAASAFQGSNAAVDAFHYAGGSVADSAIAGIADDTASITAGEAAAEAGSAAPGAAGSLSGTAGEILPYTGAVFNAFKGNFEQAALDAVGAYFGGPIGATAAEVLGHFIIGGGPDPHDNADKNGFGGSISKAGVAAPTDYIHNPGTELWNAKLAGDPTLAAKMPAGFDPSKMFAMFGGGDTMVYADEDAKFNGQTAFWTSEGQTSGKGRWGDRRGLSAEDTTGFNKAISGVYDIASSYAKSKGVDPGSLDKITVSSGAYASSKDALTEYYNALISSVDKANPSGGPTGNSSAAALNPAAGSSGGSSSSSSSSSSSGGVGAAGPTMVVGGLYSK